MHGAPTGTRLRLAALATTVFVVAEFVVGWRANSLALISDAGHNLTDAVALIVTLWTFLMAGRPADRRRTYGYHRAGVLAALANAMTLVLLAGYIFYEAYVRFLHPEPVSSLAMIVVALVAFGLNGGIVLALHSAGQADVNVRSALVHMAGDALSSVGVLVAGVAVLLSGATVWDPLVSLLIGLFILWSSWGIMRETLQILLESTPASIHVEEVAHDIESVSGVSNAHDLHIWSLSSNLHALSAHVVIENPTTASAAEIAGIVRRIKEMLAQRYAIAHTTIETHCADAPAEIGLHCVIPTREAHGHHGHSH